MLIKISSIKITDRRDADKNKVKELKESITQLGLINPITLQSDHTLIAGRHRLEACQALGWEEIPANIVTLSGLKAKLAEIDENLIRNEGTVLERSEWLKERKEVYEALFPETKAKTIGGKTGGRGREKIANAESAPAIPSSFTTDTAVKTGKSIRAIQEEIQIAANLTPEVKEIIRESDISDSKTQLLDIAREKNPEKQKAKAEEAVKKPHVSHNSGDNEWYTPPEILRAADEVMGGIDLDPASSTTANKAVNAKRFYSQEDDGLKQAWNGNVWMNPPYAQPLCKHFCVKLSNEYKAGNISQACVLVNNATETEWFSELASIATAIVFPRGRIKFVKPEGNPGAPLQGQAIIYIGNNKVEFLNRFKSFGWGAEVR